MKTLLTITAIVETTTGVALAAAPSTTARFLFDCPLDQAVSLLIARILAAALITLGTTCWLARDDTRSRTAIGLIGAMLFYNITAMTLLAYARLGPGLAGVGLWPATVLHAALAVRCASCLRTVHRERFSGKYPDSPTPRA